MNRTDVTLHGAVVRSLSLDEVILTETRYVPNEILASHDHAAPMFVLVVHGEFQERFGSRDRTCSRYDLIYRPVGERHADRFGSRGASCLTIDIGDTECCRELGDADGRLRLQGLPALYAMRLYDEMFSQQEDRDLAIDESVTLLVGSAAARHAVIETSIPKWLMRARDMIHDSFPNSLRLSRIAEDVGVHRVHLSRTFHRFFGCSVSEYARRLRVHNACAQIRNGARTMSDVGYTNGFSDESHMGRSFRRIMRCSPAGYSVTTRPSAQDSSESRA
jgi:AraC family transcriptional regulator